MKKLNITNLFDKLYGKIWALLEKVATVEKVSDNCTGLI